MDWINDHAALCGFLLYTFVLPLLAALLKLGADQADKRHLLGNGIASIVLDYGKLQWLARQVFPKLPPPAAVAMLCMMALGALACQPAKDAAQITIDSQAHQAELDKCMVDAVNGAGTQKAYFDCACAVDRKYNLPPIAECQ